MLRVYRTDDTDEVEHVAERESSQVVEGGPGEGRARHDGQVSQGAADPQHDQYRHDKPADNFGIFICKDG